MSKRTDAPYRSGPSMAWLKSKNPASEAVRREREEEWAIAMQAVFTTRLGKWNACFWPQIKVVAPELLLTAVVGAMIPKRRGWLYPQAAPMIKSLAAFAFSQFWEPR